MDESQRDNYDQNMDESQRDNNDQNMDESQRNNNDQNIRLFDSVSDVIVKIISQYRVY